MNKEIEELIASYRDTIEKFAKNNQDITPAELITKIKDFIPSYEDIKDIPNLFFTFLEELAQIGAYASIIGLSEITKEITNQDIQIAIQDISPQLEDNSKLFISFSIEETNTKEYLGITNSNLIKITPEDIIEISTFQDRPGLEELKISYIKASPNSYKAINSNVNALSIFINGINTIMIGISKKAYKIALEYAKERYQGGEVIIRKDAIKNLLFKAKNSIENMEKYKKLLSNKILSIENYIESLKMKYTFSKEGFNAITSSLQVLGGYGYMEDYGIEKQFRDILFLRETIISPFYIEKYIEDEIPQME